MPLQIPRVVTLVGPAPLYNLLPLEVCWWWLWRSGVGTGNWVAVVTNKPELVGQLAVRAGTGLNLLWGVPEADATEVADLTPYVDQLRSQVRVADGLPPIHWNQDSPLTVNHVRW